jgi:hypothetical protein
MGESATELEHDGEVAQPRSSLASVWAAAIVLVALLGYLFFYDFVVLGDGAVGAQSDTLATGQIPRDDGTIEDLIGRESGGVFTIAFPLRNGGVFVPVTVTSIEASASDAPCPWTLASVADNRENAASRAEVGGGTDPIKLSAGSTTPLYLGAVFDEGCRNDAAEEDSVDSLLLEYHVLGFIPRRASVPMATVIRRRGTWTTRGWRRRPKRWTERSALHRYWWCSAAIGATE